MFSEKVNITNTMALHMLFKCHYIGEKTILNSRADIPNFLPNCLFCMYMFEQIYC